ncbi:MAG: hypothetical protein ISS70_13855 [Phycisphaerae bacterium]|nr:hypothetical protein [Phycisphaerae bacterium]
MTENENEQPYIAIIVMLVFVALGITTLMVATYIAEIDGDAVLVVLLLIPVFVYLVITGKLKAFSFGSLSADFVDSRVKDIKKTVSEISEYEEQRSTYLGKLSQIQEKEKSKFCLIYADVDDLRQHSRKIFLKEREEERLPEKRRSEDDIRRQIIKKLEFALADAFCDGGVWANEKKKYDIFQLEEPDIAMIARGTNEREAKAVAEGSQEIFKCGTRPEKSPEGYSATIAIVASDEVKDANARKLDKMALNRLSCGKELRKGEVYTLSTSRKKKRGKTGIYGLPTY